MTEGQKALIDACVQESVPRYVASDYSFDYRKLEYRQHPAKGPMKRVKQYLEERAEQTGGKIMGVHVLNGAFMEIYWSFAGAWDEKAQCFRYWGNGDEKNELTTYDDAAQYVAEVAIDKSASGHLSCK